MAGRPRSSLRLRSRSAPPRDPIRCEGMYADNAVSQAEAEAPEEAREAEEARAKGEGPRTEGLRLRLRAVFTSLHMPCTYMLPCPALPCPDYAVSQANPDGLDRLDV